MRSTFDIPNRSARSRYSRISAQQQKVHHSCRFLILAAIANFLISSPAHGSAKDHELRSRTFRPRTSRKADSP